MLDLFLGYNADKVQISKDTGETGRPVSHSLSTKNSSSNNIKY